MHPRDALRFSWQALTSHPLRSGLILLATGFGTAAVILLSSLGEGARRYVIDEFAQLGTHLLIVLPGRNETTGGPPPLLGETPRDLSLEDALALRRSPHVQRIAPIIVGAAPVSLGHREREATVLGTTSDYQRIRHLNLAAGRFLPPGELRRSQPVVILGSRLARELFGQETALGRWVRIAEQRFRVIGLLANTGLSLGVDLGDLAIIPVSAAQALFNRAGLFRILVQAPNRASLAPTGETIRQILRKRHDGEEDFTVITQDAMLSTFDQILQALTLAVSGIAAISLLVAGVLIMNIMLVAVSQRREEIGLLKALGAARHQILFLFLMESLLLAGAGAFSGLVIAYGGTWLFNVQLHSFRLYVPLWAPLAAFGVSLLTGLTFGMLPAVRAAQLDPIAALAGR